VDTRLDAVIRRMLSLKPEERGSAKELAEALERESAKGSPETDEPLFEWETLKRTEWSREELAAAEELGHRVRRRDREVVRATAEADAARREDKPRERSWPGLLWLAAVMMLGALVLWPRERGIGSTQEELAVTQEASAEEKRDGGVTHVGDTALTSAYATMKVPAGRGVALEVPPKPVPGQIKPDAKGRCHKGQVALNGGCWFELKISPDDCPGNGVVYKGACYSPIIPSTREPTSAPMK
jgi:hypothetical protein